MFALKVTVKGKPVGLSSTPGNFISLVFTQNAACSEAVPQEEMEDGLQEPISRKASQNTEP